MRADELELTPLGITVHRCRDRHRDAAARDLQRRERSRCGRLVHPARRRGRGDRGRRRGRLGRLGAVRVGRRGPGLRGDRRLCPHPGRARHGARRRLASSATGSVILVFGAGGDRDGDKRPLMGQVAKQRADVVIVTNDNPRSEDPLAIIEDILVGTGMDVEINPDRPAAIASAIGQANAGRCRRDRGQGSRAGSGRAGRRDAVRRPRGGEGGPPHGGEPAAVIPLAWDEIVALELGELRGAPEDGVDQPRARRLARGTGRAISSSPSTPGSRFVDDALARGAAALTPHDQHAALAALARLVAAELVGNGCRGRRLDGQDLDQGRARRTVRRRSPRRSPPRRARTTRSASRSRCSGSSPTRRCWSRRWGCAATVRSRSSARSHSRSLVVVPSIGPEHLELVGTIADVARANAEAIEALPPAGSRSFPPTRPSSSRTSSADGHRREAVRSHRRSSVYPLVTIMSQATCRGEPVAVSGRRGSRSSWSCLSTSATWPRTCLPRSPPTTRSGSRSIGRQEGAARIRLSAWRGEVTELPGGGVVVNDAYNANPTSMRAALLDLAERANGRRRVAILGEMAELGVESARYHDEIGALIDELGIEVVIGVGEPARAYLDGARTAHWIADAAAFPTVAGTSSARRCDPRESVARGRARRHRVLDPEPGRGMVRVLIAGLVAMVIAVAIGPQFIEWLRRQSVGQQIREEGPKHHMAKQGTPTMGGLLIVFAAVAPFLVVSLYTIPGLTILGATVGCALIGFADDFLKVHRRRSLGLSGRWKMLGSARDHRGRRLGDDAHRLHGHRDLLPRDRRQHRPALVLLPVPVRGDRRDVERGQPHRRPRRARRRHLRDLAAHAACDRVDRLAPLG